MMPIPSWPIYWNENTPMARKTIDVSPNELYELVQQPKGQQLLSGWGKRMCRMSLGALINSPVSLYRAEASAFLGLIKLNWETTEYFSNPEEALAKLRKELGLE